MVSASQLVYFLAHPNQLRNVIQWKMWHEPVHKRDTKNETPTEKACFFYLDLTSRSFAAVIKELTPELLLPVCLFYLVLRALDTIEDDMTLDIKEKEPLLRNFKQLMETEGWNFTKSGPNEKDRELLVHFDEVSPELRRVKKPYYDIIADIAVKMGNGMADYCVNAEHNNNGVNTVKEYELYCHYVAGLVGEGLTRLFVESKLANPQLLTRMDLTESMGQFLQKTNIIRDVHEDFVDNRRFWPKQIWSKYVDNWDDMFNPENKEKALSCSSEMVLNALRHADECLYYMAGIRDQSVFNFVAIPQSMAIATLELVFRNPAIFERNVKITKGDACHLMSESTQNLRVVCDVFRVYARRIHKKNDPRDPHFLAISAQCGKIEQFIETLYPTQDPKRMPGAKKEKGARQQEPGMDTWEALIMLGAVLAVLLLIGGLMIGSAYLLGAKFDQAFRNFDDKIRAANSILSTPTAAHDEL